MAGTQGSKTKTKMKLKYEIINKEDKENG